MKTEPRVLVGQFGEGYSQRTRDGINTMGESWELTFNARTRAEHDLLLAFFRSLGGSDSFDWTSPTGTAGRWIARPWGATPVTSVANTVTVTVDQVFDVGGAVPPGMIAGLAFADVGGDGEWSGTEPGRAGIGVELLSGATVIAQTTTDRSGAYSFRGVTAGSYTVRLTAPAGYWWTTTDIGVHGNAPSGLYTLTIGPLMVSANGVRVVDSAGVDVVPPPRAGLAGLFHLNGSLANDVPGGFTLAATATPGYQAGMFGQAIYLPSGGRVSSVVLPSATIASGVMIELFAKKLSGSQALLMSLRDNVGAVVAGLYGRGIGPQMNVIGTGASTQIDGLWPIDGEWKHLVLALYRKTPIPPGQTGNSIAFSHNGTWYETEFPAPDYSGEMSVNIADELEYGSSGVAAYDECRVVFGKENFHYNIGVNFTPPDAPLTIFD